MYLGQGAANLNQLIIERFGWRNDYLLLGGFGILAAAIGFVALSNTKQVEQ